MIQITSRNQKFETTSQKMMSVKNATDQISRQIGVKD